MANEIHSLNLLKTAKALEQIIEEPLARKVLEVDATAESAANAKLLSRLIRSLEQYVNKEKEIVYIGLVGHFSSGKSTTLNSLLALDNSHHRRETDLNPTDSAITLITHTQNSNSLILMSREEATVPVRTMLIENDLLRKLVIADTPGSGDPNIANEIIQDFLPICDYILYFISSTNPIDQADLPLLHQKSLRLPFIPVKYIVTRSDEFSLNRKEDLSDLNIDVHKQNQFTGRLLARINQIIKPETALPEDLIFIDNHSKYHIEDLKNTLLNELGALDTEKMLNIHGYKLDYFHRNFYQIFDYFLNIIQKQISLSAGFQSTANENILRFDKGAEINKERLRLSWNMIDLAFRQEIENEIFRLNSLRIDDIPVSLEQERLIKELRIELSGKIDGQVQGYYGKLIGEINTYFKNELRNQKFQLNDKISKLNLAGGRMSSDLPSRLNFIYNEEQIEVDFSKNEEQLNSLFQRINNVLQTNKANIRLQLNSLASLATEMRLVISLDQQYNNGSKSIQDNFSQYFGLIEMYRNTVLSKNNKQTIEKLRIGTELDELDDDFSSEFIESMTKDAINGIFSNSSDKKTEFLRQMNLQILAANDLKAKLEGIERIKRENATPLGKGKINLSNLLFQIINTKQEKINRLYQARSDKVLNEDEIAYNQYLENVEQKKRNRKKFILKWTIGTGLFTLGIFIGLKFFNYFNSSTMAASIVAGIIANLVGDIFGFTFSVLKSDTKKITLRSSKEFVVNHRTYLQNQFDEKFWDTLSAAIGEDTQNQQYLAQVKTLYQAPIIEQWNDLMNIGSPIYSEVLLQVKNLNELIESVKHDEQDFYNHFSTIFSNGEKNSDVVDDITKKIKEVSIKPSFELLSAITERLQFVKAKILGVKQTILLNSQSTITE